MEKIVDYKKIYVGGVFLLIFGVYLFFTLQHVGQFETADEHYWIYSPDGGRVQQYWHAVLTGDWVGTLINDKPGVTVALVCGLVNGLLVAVVGILPFLVTLGMMSVARGVATVLTTGQYISFPNAAPWFTQFGRYEFHIPGAIGHYGLPVTLVLGLALVVITSLLFSYWTPLRSFFFVGESPEAARLSGIRVTRLTVAAYLLSTLFVWFTAVLLISANKIGYANYGVGAEMRALAAAVVGGASLAGGAGNIFGTFLGVLMLALIGNGFVMLNGNPNWQQASVGIVLIAAVGIDALRTYRDRR